MNCPSCGQGLPAGSNQRCPFCATLLSPPTEGTLAPHLVPFVSPLPASEEPLREIPGLRKRERTWKDEVKERVDDRRRIRSGGELPLFPGPEEGSSQEASEGPAPSSGSALREADQGPDRLGDPEDLPLRPREPAGSEPAGEAEASAELRGSPRKPFADLDEEPEDDDWSLGRTAEASVTPVERPAGAAERLLAAALDTLFWGSLAAVVVYFSGRVARVAPWGLRPVWPYLFGYLALLGIGYAVYFTGTTGQTLGKMATRLRVVDSQGRPPVYGRALLRALLGSLGIALAALGLAPILFDPARRAVHDRLTRTRVVKSA